MANLQGPTTITGTSAVKLPQGTTAQRPSASAGMTRYNTSLGYAEYYNGTSWTRLVTTRETVLAQSNAALVSATFAGNNFNLAGSAYFSSGYFGVDKSYTFTNGAAISIASNVSEPVAMVIPSDAHGLTVRTAFWVYST